ncbi:formate nitrite transporter, partial [Haematococcus lacustris]
MARLDGELKSKWRFDKQVVMGLIAAFYIGFSFTVCMVIGGQIPQIQASNPGLQSLIYGAFGFPLGLFMICVCWVLSWFANLAGSIIMANIVYAAWIFHGREEFTVHLAEHKVAYPFSVCLMKGVLANWLVNLAIWI